MAPCDKPHFTKCRNAPEFMGPCDTCKFLVLIIEYKSEMSRMAPENLLGPCDSLARGFRVKIVSVAWPHETPKKYNDQLQSSGVLRHIIFSQKPSLKSVAKPQTS